mmetsp:Transcript_50344/g.89954  ORF Transcript_50344/g.89954 Transcript_50344/m.89954 type:complete len:86 (-) Transcript_50344:737-994(-)
MGTGWATSHKHCWWLLRSGSKRLTTPAEWATGEKGILWNKGQNKWDTDDGKSGGGSTVRALHASERGSPYIAVPLGQIGRFSDHV